MAIDLAHIETACKVTHSIDKELCQTLKGGVDIIVVPAGIPRKPGQKREELMNANAPIAFAIAKVTKLFNRSRDVNFPCRQWRSIHQTPFCCSSRIQ